MIPKLQPRYAIQMIPKLQLVYAILFLFFASYATVATSSAVIPCGRYYNDESRDISLNRILTTITEGILKDGMERRQCSITDEKAVLEYRGIWGSDLLVETYYATQYDDDWATNVDPYQYRLSVSNGNDGYSSTNREEYEACRDMIALACQTLDQIEGHLQDAAVAFPYQY